MRSLCLVSVFMFLLMGHLTTGAYYCLNRENSTGKYYSKVDIPDFSIVTWQINNKNGTALYKCTCTLMRGYCNCPPQVVGTSKIYPNFTSSGGDLYTGQLWTETPGREMDQTEVLCTINGVTYTICNLLETYALEPPKCDYPELNADNTEVTVSCRSDRCHPKANMDVSLNAYNNSGTFYANFDEKMNITCEHNEVSSDPVYYTSQCNVTIPVDQLYFPGSIISTLNVSMYPLLSIPSLKPRTSVAVFLILDKHLSCAEREKFATYYLNPDFTFRNGSVVTWDIERQKNVLYTCTCTLVDGACACPRKVVGTTAIYPEFKGIGDNLYTGYLYRVRPGRELDQTSVLCTIDGVTFSICDDTNIYSLETPTCDDLKLTADSTEILVSCRSDRCYPKANMEISLIAVNDSGTFQVAFNKTIYPTCEHKQVSSDPVYYTSQCNVTIPVDQLYIRGSLMTSLNVSMYPVLRTSSIKPITSVYVSLDYEKDDSSKETATNLKKWIGVGVGAYFGIVVIVVVIIVVVVIRRKRTTKNAASTNAPQGYCNVAVVHDSAYAQPRSQ